MLYVPLSARAAGRCGQLKKILMLSRWAEELTSYLVTKEVIPEEKASLYKYGYLQCMRGMVKIFLMLVTALIMGMLWQSLVILLSFSIIRVYAGGYHARSPILCVIESWVLFVFVLGMYQYIPFCPLVSIALIAGLYLCIGLVCPIPDINKPLEQYEVKRYRKNAALLLSCETFVFFIAFVAGYIGFSYCVSLGNLMTMIVLVCGLVKNHVNGITIAINDSGDDYEDTL